MSCPGFRSIDAPSSASRRADRGRSAAAEATTTRAVPAASACSARARADVTPTCGAMPRYGSTSCDGNGSTARSAAAVRQAFERREEEAHVGDGLFEVAVAGHDVQHDAVRQRVRGRRHEQRLRRRRQARHRRAGASIPLRATAAFRARGGSARSKSSLRRIPETSMSRVAGKSFEGRCALEPMTRLSGFRDLLDDARSVE